MNFVAEEKGKTMREYVKIYCCGDCIYYDMKKHRCRLGAHEEGKPTDRFYRDCPMGIHTAQPEPLTDKEQRIFLAAMGREEKVCKQTDEECRDCREPYEDSLVWVCKEIVRKVKGALWKT